MTCNADLMFKMHFQGAHNRKLCGMLHRNLKGKEREFEYKKFLVFTKFK